MTVKCESYNCTRYSPHISHLVAKVGKGKGGRQEGEGGKEGGKKGEANKLT